ncbi:hypothetical protein MKK84_00055 [Methylobacterium sp. E-065]|uniref:hypothetical protein n=1 Tax=Methylobacterium sp. E-065 TaxID=2836583 RepID=UPI001FBBC834|nr:hypothetical protein [Methylobacterium sp. E-065]MCJ2015832.1 hypothetical protein [Methylobacterium sp. E-065]
MSADTPEARAIWKAQLVAFLIPHLKGDAAEQDSALNAVLTAIDTAHSEGLRQAARFCREVGAGAWRHREAAVALAESIEQMATREDERSAEAARKWQDEP